ncbi:hypothetical protein LXL04_037992 [Taraxacum kok-saghyz]
MPLKECGPQIFGAGVSHGAILEPGSKPTPAAIRRRRSLFAITDFSEIAIQLENLAALHFLHSPPETEHRLSELAKAS